MKKRIICICAVLLVVLLLIVGVSCCNGNSNSSEEDEKTTTSGTEQGAKPSTPAEDATEPVTQPTGTEPPVIDPTEPEVPEVSPSEPEVPETQPAEPEVPETDPVDPEIPEEKPSEPDDIPAETPPAEEKYDFGGVTVGTIRATDWDSWDKAKRQAFRDSVDWNSITPEERHNFLLATTYDDYDCGFEGHACRGDLHHESVMAGIDDGCDHCGSHDCISLLVVDPETLFTWPDPRKCPEYNILKDPTEYCGICGLPHQGEPGTICVIYQTDGTCYACGGWITAWTCHCCDYGIAPDPQFDFGGITIGNISYDIWYSWSNAKQQAWKKSVAASLENATLNEKFNYYYVTEFHGDYHCGHDNHWCVSKAGHDELIKAMEEGCPYCGAHDCASFYARNDRGITEINCEECPKYHDN